MIIYIKEENPYGDFLLFCTIVLYTKLTAWRTHVRRREEIMRCIIFHFVYCDLKSLRLCGLLFLHIANQTHPRRIRIRLRGSKAEFDSLCIKNSCALCGLLFLRIANITKKVQIHLNLYFFVSLIN